MANSPGQLHANQLVRACTASHKVSKLFLQVELGQQPPGGLLLILAGGAGLLVPGSDGESEGSQPGYLVRKFWTSPVRASRC
jgi:hypothetical protein